MPISDAQKFVNYVCSSNPTLFIQTYEATRAISRCVSAISAVVAKDKDGKDVSFHCATWGILESVRPATIKNKVLEYGAAIEGVAKGPMGPLDWLETAPDNTVLFLKDYHVFLNDKSCGDAYKFIAKIRGLIDHCNATGKAIVFVSPNLTIPDELSKDITPVDFALPTKEDLYIVLKKVCQDTGATMPKDKDVDKLLSAALAMTCKEAENAFSLSLVEAKKFDVELIRREKAIIVKKTKNLEVVETKESLATVAGLEIAKEWAVRKADSFTPEAKAYGVVPPKALLLMGDPGTGKSLLAKALANTFNRTLLRADISKILDKYHGESEAKLTALLATAAAVNPCLLWFDEIEKMFAKSSGGDTHEVAKHLLGILLTWLEENTSDVIVIATANDVTDLDSALMSRFDTAFWVSLPDSVQKVDMFKIHLKKAMDKVGRPLPSITDAQITTELIPLTKKFSGRDIMHAVIDAVDRAYNKRHPEIQIEDLKEAVQAIKPIAGQREDAFKKLRESAGMNVLEASINHDAVPESSNAANAPRKINTTGIAG